METLEEQISLLRAEQTRLEAELAQQGQHPNRQHPCQQHQQQTVTTTTTAGAAGGAAFYDARQVTEISVNCTNNRQRSTIACGQPQQPQTVGTPGGMPCYADCQGLQEQQPLSLHERLRQLEALKLKYQREANKAMSNYYSAVSQFPTYQTQREEKLKSARPFTFAARELTRPTSIRERREEEERQQREEQERAMRENHFKATPVPPTTFMNKYDVMVEEWCERKAAAELRARELADAAREEAAFVRLSAQGLRHTREELLGAVYDPKTGRAITRSEQQQQRHRRAQSAEARAATQLEDIPLEVRMTLWPAIKEHEHVRRQRIKQTATVRKSKADEHFKAVMPLLSSPTPHQLGPTPLFGIGQPIFSPPTAASAGTAVTTSAVAVSALGVAPAGGGLPPPPIPTPQPLGAAAAAVSAAPVAVGVPPALAAMAPPPPSPMAVPLAQPMPGAPSRAATPATTATSTAVGVTAQVPPQPAGPARPPSSAAAGPAAAPKPRSRSRSPASARNPNFTFRPRVRPGVPDFKALWAEDRVQLLERKKAHPTTTPEPFDLQPSAKDGVVRGKRASRAVSQPPARRRSAAASGRPPKAAAPSTTTQAASQTRTTAAATTGTRTTTTTTTAVGDSAPKTTTTTTTTTTAIATANTKTTDTTNTAAPAGGARGTGVPKGTRAHALRTEAVYAKYLNQAAQVDDTSAEDESFLRTAAQRRKEVAKRLGEYLVDARTEHEHVIRGKVRALRAAMKENEEAAEQRLAEMRVRVAQMPPLFAEPVGLNDQSKARAEAEQTVVGLLKQSGLDTATIRSILVNPGAETDAERAAVDGAEATAAAAATADETTTKADGEEERKKSAKGSAASSDFESSSSASSNSSSSGSSSSDDDSSTQTTPTTKQLSVPPPALAVPNMPLPAPVPVASTSPASPAYDDDSFEDSSDDLD